MTFQNFQQPLLPPTYPSPQGKVAGSGAGTPANKSTPTTLGTPAPYVAQASKTPTEYAIQNSMHSNGTPGGEGGGGDTHTHNGAQGGRKGGVGRGDERQPSRMKTPESPRGIQVEIRKSLFPMKVTV